MLNGYDKQEAAKFILRRLYPEDYPTLTADQLPSLVAQCIDADFAYMLTYDILRADGSEGGCYYNTENAFNFILIELIRRHRLPRAAVPDLYMLVDDYMDFNRSYLERKGLQYPMDEA